MIDKWDKLPRDTIMQEIHKIVPELNIEDISSLLDTINVRIGCSNLQNIIFS